MNGAWAASPPGADSVRVLHLIASSRGGGAVHVRDLALELHARRFSVAVGMPDDGPPIWEDLVSRAVPVHRIEIGSGLMAGALREIRRLTSDRDVLHLHGARAAFFGRLAWLPAALRARLRPSVAARRPSIIYTVHGFAAPHQEAPRRAALLTVERVLGRVITDQFVAVCQTERDALLAARIARPEHVQVIRNGVDVGRFRPTASRARCRAVLGLPEDAFVITTICRLDRPRDFETLLHAVRAVVAHHPTAYLLVVGDGPLRRSIEVQIAQLDLGRRVTLCGWRRDVGTVHAASDIYTLTTWGWEGLPLSILEAMAAGLPVVATNAGGVPEIVVDGETGRLVTRRDPEALATAIGALLEDPAGRVRLGVQGHDRVAGDFTLARMVEETVALYQALRTRVVSAGTAVAATSAGSPHAGR